MKANELLLAGAAVATAALAYLYATSKPKGALAVAPVAQAPEEVAQGAGVEAPSTPPPAGVGLPDIDVSQIGGSGAAGVASTIIAGLVISEGAGQVVEALGGGKGKADLVRLSWAGPPTWGVGTAMASDWALEQAGMKDADTRKHISMVAGIGAGAASVFGAPAIAVVAAGKGILEAGSWALGEIAGEQAEHDARWLVSRLDPTLAGTPLNVPVAWMGAGMESLMGSIGGLFGPKKKK